MFDTFLKICGAITVVAAALVIVNKAYRLWLPVTASITCTLAFDGRPDSLAVTLTNRSNAAVYIRSCKVRCTYSVFGLFVRHLRNPFLAPRLYPNLRYHDAVYELVGKEPLKLEPAQLVEVKTDIYEHPLNALSGPMLIAFARLTTGRTVCSKRVESPPVWRMIGRRGERIPKK